MHDTQTNDKATTANNWKTPGATVSRRHNWLTERDNCLAVLLEVLLTLAFLETSGFIDHQHLMFLFDLHLR